MDACFAEIFVDFLGVAFHNILFYASIYPKNIFESRRKYGTVVYRSKHPEVNRYIDMCLKSILECLKSGKLNRIEFVVTDGDHQPKLKFVFDIERTDQLDKTTDAYLLYAEQNLRAFCLKLANMRSKFERTEDSSFSIYLHTAESAAMALASHSELQDFPLVEVDRDYEDSDGILPLKRLTVRDYSLDVYLEIS